MNPTCIITGASHGLGRCLAERFAAENFDIAICARRAADLQQFADELQAQYPHINLFWQACDMSDKTAIAAFMQAVVTQAKGEIALLINNVGAFDMGRISTEPEGRLEQMMSLNLYAAYYSVKNLLPQLITQKKGHIINIGSIAAIEPLDDCAAYSISKHALHAYTQLLRRDLAQHHIRVTGVLPGAMLTRSWDGATIAPEKIMPPQEVAEMIWQCHHLSNRTVIENIVLKPMFA
jgi:short-subunit dehydrogenase